MFYLVLGYYNPKHRRLCFIFIHGVFKTLPWDFRGDLRMKMDEFEPLKLDVIWTLDEIGGDMHLMGIYMDI